jgi:hypothetical protein
MPATTHPASLSGLFPATPGRPAVLVVRRHIDLQRVAASLCPA